MSASEYIKLFPRTFDKFESENFMSQVLIMYDNGMFIYVNRNPEKEWELNLNLGPGYYNFHAIINKNDSLLEGHNNLNTIILPKSNGWLCFKPD